LQVSDIDLNDSYIRFGKSFDDSGLGHEYYVIKEMYLSDDTLMDIGDNRGIGIFQHVRESNNLHIQFG